MTTQELFNLLKSLGLRNLRIGNSNIYSLCPKHEETRPSWGISTNPPFLHCCFSCNFRGTLRTLLLDKGWSLEKIKNILGEKFDLRPAKFSFVSKAQTLFSLSKGISEQNLWPYTLDKPAIDYLESRGITLRTMLQTGLLWHKKDCRILFPWWVGNIFLGATGRTVSKREEKVGRKIIAYFGLKKKLLYLPLKKLDSEVEVILIEGEISALRVLQAGFTNVAALGKGTISHETCAWLENLPVKSLCLFFDNDETGEKLSYGVWTYMNSICPIYVVEYPSSKRKDPAELTKFEVKVAIKRKRRVTYWSNFST